MCVILFCRLVRQLLVSHPHLPSVKHQQQGLVLVKLLHHLEVHQEACLQVVQLLVTAVLRLVPVILHPVPHLVPRHLILLGEDSDKPKVVLVHLQVTFELIYEKCHHVTHHVDDWAAWGAIHNISDKDLILWTPMSLIRAENLSDVKLAAPCIVSLLTLSLLIRVRLVLMHGLEAIVMNFLKLCQNSNCEEIG